MLAALRDRFRVLGGTWTVISQVNLSEIPDALAANRRAYTLGRDCNWSADDEVGEFCDAVIVAAKETADVSATDADDKVVEFIDGIYQPNRAMVIEAIQWLSVRDRDGDETQQQLQAFASAKGFEGTGESGSGFVVWIEIAALVWKLVRPFLQK